MNDFRLVPFPGTKALPPIELQGSIELQEQILTIDYRLTGDLNKIVIPDLNSAPTRKFELWEHTCLEFFIGTRGEPAYWEFNLSPSGDWNVFHLDDYRQGLCWEERVSTLPVTVDRSANSIELKLAFDLSQIMSGDRDLEVAITAVIESITGEISYWALTHAGKEADFHLRDSFTISLPD